MLLCLIVFAVTAGHAQADLLGDTLKPFASVTQMYDSNVFRVKDQAQLKALISDDRLADFIAVATVGTGLHYKISSQELNLLLQRDFIRYSHYSHQNTDRDLARGDLDLNLFDRVRIKAGGAYCISPQPRTDFRSAGLNEVTTLTRGMSVGYEMTSGAGYKVAYGRTTVHYSLPQFKADEHTTDSYSGTMSYRLSPDSRVYASYQRDEIQYREEPALVARSVNNSSAADSIRFGLDKTFSPKTAVSGYAGYLDRRHNTASARNFSGVIGKAALSYGMTPRLGLVVNWERQLYEETYSDRIYSINDSFTAGFVHQFGARLKGSLSDRLSWKKFQDMPGAGVARRTDFSQEVTAGVEWTPIARLILNAGYQFTRRSSDDLSFDYDDHALTAGIAYQF